MGDIMFEVYADKTIYLDNDNNIKGEVTYKTIGENLVDINHTYVDVSLRGRGIANLLLKKAFEYFRNNNIKVKCSCSYAKKWIMNHDEYQDLIVY